MSPRFPQVTDDVFCMITAEATDADSDATTYSFAWTVNGNAYVGPTSTTDHAGDTTPAANTHETETWACTVTTKDDEVTGPTASATAEVFKSDGLVRHTDGSWFGVDFVRCGSGAPNTCTMDAAKTACAAVGLRVVSHASDDTPATRSLGATNSCQWSVSYFTVIRPMAPDACLVGVSNLDWSQCCGMSSWHGNTLLFPAAGDTFGYVEPSNTGYDPSLPNGSGATWGCTTSPAENVPGCATQYVACAR